MRSLRSKLVLTFGACMILILGIVVTYTAYKLRSQAIESAHTHILQTVRNTAWRSKAVIDQGVISSRILASVISGIEATSLKETTAAMDATLAHAMRENRSLVAAFVSHANQCQFTKESSTLKKSSIESSLWLRDPDRGLYSQSMSPLKFLKKEWCHAGLDDNLVVTDIFKFPFGTKDRIVYAILTPLHKSGKVTGMIGVILDGDEFQAIIDEVEKAMAPKEAKISLLSWYGSIVASTLGTDMRGQSMEILRPYCNLSLTDLQTGKRSELDAFDYIGYRIPVPILGLDTPWSLGMRIPSSLMLQEANKLVRELVGIALGLILLGVFAIVFGAAQIANPIRKLSEITRRVAKGDFDQEIPIAGKDEIGELAEDFRVMLISRKETEVELFRQQHILSAIFERAPVAMALFNAEFRVVKINRKAASMLGYRASTAQNRLPGEVLQCAAIAGSGLGCGDSGQCKKCFIRLILEEVIESGQAIHGREGEFVQESGAGKKSFCLEVNAESVELDDGIQVILTIVDVTEHTRDKKKLESNEKLLSTILDRLPVGMVLIDVSSHTIHRVNPYAASMIGAPENQILGKTCHNYICPAEKGKCPITDLGKQVEDKERVLLTALGEKVPIIKTVVPVILEGTEYLLETFIDISDIKRMEDALRRAKQAAESSLESAELYAVDLETANDELDKALIAARQASIAKSEFLANMSHEIRTPMNGIVGFSDILMDMEMEERPREFLSMIKLSADRLLCLINDILDFSKIEAGHLELELHDFGLRKFLDENLSVFWVAARDKGLSLEWQVDEDVPDHFLGDSGRLGQVLTNLVGNAIKFTKIGSVEISVHIQSCEDENVTLYIKVKDTGIGIAAENQLVIFQEFAQGDGSHTRKYGGTGLGLAISAKLVALMGGRVWVESAAVGRRSTDRASKESSGSVFHFTVKMTQILSLPPSAEALYGRVEKQMFAQPVTVLLAEDDEINRIFVEELLRSRNCQVVSVENGREAIRAIAENYYDIVLMDIQMPVMDGICAIKEIRKQEKGSSRHLPVIALTAHAMIEHREECLLVGMDDYLTKPLVVEELLAAIKKFL